LRPDLQTTSRLRDSPLLGRKIRVGAASELGTPTSELALEALRRGDRTLAREYFDYYVDEGRRIVALYSLWLRHLVDYTRERVPAADDEIQRLTRLMGAEPPIVDADGVVGTEAALGLRAIESGYGDDLVPILRDLRENYVAVHDAQADWCWGLLTVLRDSLGEDAMDEVFRVTQGAWVGDRYAALADMTPEESFQLAIEGMRGHHCGRLRDGRIDVVEDDEKWVMSFDPCGSGGRMRRGDPERGQTPRESAPFNFARTERPHDWSWNRAGVCLYCAHCAVVNEILPIERLGAPMRVTENPEHAGDPCTWTIYKRPELVPDEAYRRVGKAPPARRAGDEPELR
jgi:hypothetical protein